MKPGVSVVVLTRNEESIIRECLKGLEWAHEVIVVDCSSTDQTPRIARESKARVIPAVSSDFSELRNQGFLVARYEWVLYIDADERVDERLRASIGRVIEQKAGPESFFLERQNFFFGRPWPQRETLLRMVRHDAFVRWRGALHETMEVRGLPGRLGGLLLHNTHRNVDQMFKKTIVWSDTEAKLRFENGHPGVVPWRLLRVMTTGFFHSYFKSGGWRCGSAGIVEGLYQAFSYFITYAKLWELQYRSPLKEA